MSKLLPELNIGLIGHVDHGKTTLTSALSGKWTSVHSEEIKRGITIKLGYADATFYYCEKDKLYTSSEKCPKCEAACKPLRMISFIDAPGHETLMAIMVSGAAIMDAALLLVAANEPCPQPQTQEHLMALKVLGIKNIIIVQNKIDLLAKEDAKKNYDQIKDFTKKTLGFDVPIIPISAARKINIDILIESIQELFKTPERNSKKPVRMLIARSFDVNKPGSDISKLQGGVLGGAITQGIIEQNKEIEIRPGLKKEVRNQIVWQPIKTKVINIVSGSQSIKEKGPGGSVAISTLLDPALTKGDSFVGHVVSYSKDAPEILDILNLKVKLFDKVVGLKEDKSIELLKVSEPLMLSSGTATTLGVVQDAGKTVKLTLKRPVCIDKGGKIAISRRFGNRWHLIGFGEVI